MVQPLVLVHRLARRLAAIAIMLGLAVLTATPARAGATLIVQNGILTGATGVDVSGTLYDVAFRDGTCAQIYGACDAAHFTFATSASAQAASQALLEQVFIDGPAGDFDSHPELTAGCAHIHTCNAFTAYALDTAQASFYRWSATNVDPTQLVGDNATQMTNFITLDTSASSISTWAVWTAQTTGRAPEPGSIALVAAALALLSLARSRH